MIYPFLHDKPFITEYDRFVLRNAGTDWNVVHFRDGLMQRLMKNTYSGYVGSEPVVMFLNGAFWEFISSMKSTIRIGSNQILDLKKMRSIILSRLGQALL